MVVGLSCTNLCSLWLAKKFRKRFAQLFVNTRIPMHTYMHFHTYMKSKCSKLYRLGPLCHPWLRSNGCNQKIRLIFYILTKSALSILWDFAPTLPRPLATALFDDLHMSARVGGKYCKCNMLVERGEGGAAEEGIEIERRCPRPGIGVGVFATCAPPAPFIWARRSNSTFLLHSSRHSTGCAMKKDKCIRAWHC